MFTYAIGDIHGCYNQLVEMLEKISTYDAHQNFSGEMSKIVFLGDYVDRGPDSYHVVKKIRSLTEKFPQKYIALMGNHEDMLLYDKDCWWANGGLQTNDSYIHNKAKVEEDYDWFKSLPTFYEDKLRYFVHAGVDPRHDLDDQNTFSQLWIRDSFLESNKDFGKLVVHGHTPQKGNIVQKFNRINLDTGCVFGYKLSCAVFDDQMRDPLDFLQVNNGG